MKHIGLFEGIGGFSLAAKWMGWETVAWCEINSYCQKLLQKNFPWAQGYGDIKKTCFKKYENTIDIVTGGFPCQPYSLAGKRKGKNDERHLWPEMLRSIREIKPRWILGENVPGLVNWDGGLVFDEVQTDLETEGYEVQAYILPACAKNASHRRERVWFIAHTESQRLETENKKNGYSLGLSKETPPFINRCTTNEWEHRRPDIGAIRRNDGIPNWMDRISGLGNAVVPVVVLEFYKAIEKYNLQNEQN